jgi:hypothetical protein
VGDVVHGVDHVVHGHDVDAPALDPDRRAPTAAGRSASSGSA